MDNPWILGLIVFVTQVIFVYLRTLNIHHVVDRDILKSLISGNSIAGLSLIINSASIYSIYHLYWFPIVMFFIGGSLGLILALKK